MTDVGITLLMVGMFAWFLKVGRRMSRNDWHPRGEKPKPLDVIEGVGCLVGILGVLLLAVSLLLTARSA